MLAALILTATAPIVPRSAAEATGSIEQGRRIVQARCSICHAVSGPGPSPLVVAPAFSTFARKWPIEYLAEALAEGVTAGHGGIVMPEFVFSPAEIDDLLAYLESVQE